MPHKIVQSRSGRYYGYDSNTNAILELDDLTGELLRRCERGSLEACSRAMEEQFEAGRVAERRIAVEEARRNGWFARNQLRSFRNPAKELNLREELTKSISHVVLTLTEDCNLRCGYCVYSASTSGHRNHSRRRMPWSVARSAIDLLVNSSSKADGIHLGFYGGEPFLAGDLMQRCIGYARERAAGRQVHFHATTNGTCLTSEQMRLLANNDVWLTVSIDGPEDVHDASRRFRGGGGSWKSVMNALCGLHERYPRYYEQRVGINCVLKRGDQLPRVVAFFRSSPLMAECSGVSMRWVQDDSCGTAHKGAGSEVAIQLRDEFVEQVVTRSFPDRGALASLFLPVLTGIHTRRRRPVDKSICAPLGTCVPGMKELGVDVDGGLHICSNMPPGFEIGNVDVGIDYAAVGELMDEFCASMIGRCKRCWAVRLCGTCFVTACLHMSNEEHMRRECRAQRAAIADALSLYVSVLERDPQSLGFLIS